MLLASEIKFQSVSTEDLQGVAEELQRALPAATVTPINRRSRPTSWQSNDAIALRLQEDDRKKPFMMVGLQGAVIAPENASPDTLDAAMGKLSEKLEVQDKGANTASAGVVCTLIFLALFASVLIEKAIPESVILTGILGSGVVLFFAGLTMFGIRSTKAPRKGRSGLAMLLMVPGLLMMAPMSMLNLPLINYFRRQQGSRLLQ